MDILSFIGLILVYYAITNMAKDFNRIANALESMSQITASENDEQE